MEKFGSSRGTELPQRHEGVSAIRSRNVAVLMAVRNGEPYIEEQLDSLARQKDVNVDLWVSDDGSSDATMAILERRATAWPLGTVRLVTGPRKGFAENFRSLLLRSEIEADHFAFCDQDDVWDADKLAHAVEWLETQPAGLPALYCSRTRIVSAEGEPLGLSPLFPRPPSFRNAIVQSIAGGNTMVMNRAARDVVAEACRRTSFVSHDWWCYLMVAGAGGSVFYCRDSRIGYRQHGANLVGQNSTWRARMSRIGFLFRGRFKDWNERNLAGLAACTDLLTDEARRIVAEFEAAREGRFPARILALRRSGVYRQTMLGEIGLYVACAIKRL